MNENDKDECKECEGYGYFATGICRNPEREPVHGVKIQRCDSCEALGSDEMAAIKFVRDFELLDVWALKMANEIALLKKNPWEESTEGKSP